MPDFIPRRDVEVKHFTMRLSEYLSADPQAYGSDPATAQRYARLVRAFAETYAASQSNRNRTPTVLTLKDGQRAELVKMTRSVARWARVHATERALMAVGLRLRRPARRHVRPPTGVPGVKLTVIDDRLLRVSVVPTPATQRGGLPTGAAGIQVWWQIGDQPVDRWQGPVIAARSSLTLSLVKVDAPLGSKVWVVANYLSRRHERGPTSRPVGRRLSFDPIALPSAA